MNIKEMIIKYRELLLYGVIGGFCALLDFGIYSLLSIVIPFLLANIISVHCGILCSFILNRNFNFKVRDNTGRRFVSFYLVGIAGLALSELLIIFMTKRLELHHLVAKLMTVVIVALFQFSLNKLITFNRNRLVKDEKNQL